MEINKKTAPIVQLLGEIQPEPIIDDRGDVVYFGEAPLGTPQNEPLWKISRSTTSGTVTIVEYAQGTMENISAWSERESYNYTR